MQKPTYQYLSLCVLVLVISITGSSYTHPAAPAIHYTDTTSNSAGHLVNADVPLSFSESKMQVYDSLHLDVQGLSRETFELALHGMEKLVEAGKVKGNIISIADFSQPSVNKRLYVIDLDQQVLLFQSLVSHGVNSGKEWARSFSNKPSSHKSSLGFYVTGEPYIGSNGYSLKLKGLEKNINDNAFRRAIVLHGADYVCEELASSQGYIGRSYGCPAVPTGISHELIDDIKEGTCLFIYHPTTSYTRYSRLLK